MASQPKKAEGRYTKRGDTYVMIEHSQSADVVGLVSIEAGYPYNENSKVKVEIDGEAYEFYTHPRHARGRLDPRRPGGGGCHAQGRAHDRARHLPAPHVDDRHLFVEGRDRGLPGDQQAMRRHMSLAVPAADEGRRNLIGLDRRALGEAVATLGLEPWRAGQIWGWIYRRGAVEFGAMTDIAKPLRARLAERFSLDRPVVRRAETAADGTRKWLLGLAGGHEVETVHIPERTRITLCLSSQVGCTLTCRFCYTGTQRLVRNLEAAEIVAQVLAARDALGAWPTPVAAQPRNNVVLMGMGEPLYNYDNVAAALAILMDGEGLGISRRRITLSTAGVVPMIRRCAAELGVKLAVSLHAVEDGLRDRLVPLNRKYPIAELIAACRDYAHGQRTRRITFEYVMLKGVNDSEAEARALVRLIEGIPAKINLIPFNPWPGAPFECASAGTIERFAEVLRRAGYVGTVPRAPGPRHPGGLRPASHRERACAHEPAGGGLGRCSPDAAGRT